MTRVSCNLFLGFTDPDKPEPWAGLWTLATRINAATLFKTAAWDVSVNTWDCDAKTLADQVAAGVPDRIVTVSYSWGNDALIAYCKQLANLDRTIDVAFIIDPVPCVWGRWITCAIFNHDYPWKLPVNVSAFWSARTVNQKTWFMPWGRDVSYPAGMEPLGRIAFGSEANLAKWNPLGTQIVDGEVYHDTIDSDVRVHDAIIEQIGALKG